MKLGLTLGALMVLAAPAFAQDAMVCHHGGATYSPGSFIPQGTTPHRCTIDGGAAVWAAAEDAEANCFYAGEEYSRGSMILVDLTPLLCSKGVWFVKKD